MLFSMIRIAVDLWEPLKVIPETEFLEKIKHDFFTICFAELFISLVFLGLQGSDSLWV